MGKLMNDGFTLIEVLIVMMVITLLSLVFTSKLKLSEDTYHAQTIKISNKICVFQLGMGRYSCE